MIKKKNNSIATNRRAGYDYKIGDKFEAGIVLKGSEVKSLRSNRVDISHAFISNENGEIFLKNSSIPQYLSSGMLNHEVSRTRKLLFKNIVLFAQEIELYPQLVVVMTFILKILD